MPTLKTSVVIADDHTLVRKAIVDMVEGFAKFKVLFDANNGAELIAWLETAATIPQICILDVEMPVMNGLETLKVLKRKWPKIKVLVVTMIENEITIIKMMKAGADGYMLKAGNPSEFEKALLDIDSRGFYDSELSKELLDPKNKGHLPNITDREIQFLKYCSTELTYRQIADEMGISTRTIDGFRETLFSKLNIKSRIGLAVFALKSGLTS